MFKLNSILTRAMLALALVTGSAAAVAGPVYHVDVDTAAQGNGNGGLLLSFTSLAGGTANAVVTNWTGAFLNTGTGFNGTEANFDTDMLALSNDFGAYLFDVAFGGHFGFDVSFDIDVAGDVGSAFAVSLADDQMNPVSDDLVTIAFEPGQQVSATAVAPFATVTPAAVGADVPEPADWALVMSGLGLMGFALRRRTR